MWKLNSRPGFEKNSKNKLLVMNKNMTKFNYSLNLFKIPLIRIEEISKSVAQHGND